MMSDYFTAYRERMERNDTSLRKFGKELIDKGYEVFINKEKLVSMLFVRKDNKHCWVSFNEVPYRWIISISWVPSKENGSGTTVKNNHNPEFDITLDDVEKSMAPIPNRLTIWFMKQLKKEDNETSNIQAEDDNKEE